MMKMIAESAHAGRENGPFIFCGTKIEKFIPFKVYDGEKFGNYLIVDVAACFNSMFGLPSSQEGTSIFVVLVLILFYIIFVVRCLVDNIHHEDIEALLNSLKSPVQILISYRNLV